MKPREVIKEMEKRGWRIVRYHGDHGVFQHDEHPGSEVIPLDRNLDRYPRSNRALRSLFRRLDRLETPDA